MISLAPHHTFGLQAYCHKLKLVEHPQQLLSALSELQDTSLFVIGGGSNCIFLEDFPGTVVKNHLMGKSVERRDDSFVLTVGAGENWHRLVKWCLQQQIYGFENLALIPGTVGAAPIQNIGAYGIEIERFIEYVECLDRHTYETVRLSAEECQFGYRDSIFKRALAEKCVITQLAFRLPVKWQPVLDYAELQQLDNPQPTDIFNKVVEIRQRKLPDPERIGNAGSFFKNPVISAEHFTHLSKDWPTLPGFRLSDEHIKVPAAWLIDQLGFKGKKRGGIACHTNQPLVLTNDGSGTGEQLLTLAREIRDKVQQVFAITLENEVRLIGATGSITL